MYVYVHMYRYVATHIASRIHTYYMHLIHMYIHTVVWKYSTLNNLLTIIFKHTYFHPLAIVTKCFTIE